MNRTDKHALDENAMRDEQFSAMFRGIYSDAIKQVRRYVDEFAAADIVADAFLVLWRRWDEIPHDEDIRRRWFYGTLRRCVLHHFERRDRQTRLLDRLEAQRTRHSDGGLATTVESTQSVAAILTQLPQAQRLAVFLSIIQGMSSRDAVALIGCSPSAFSSNLSRAKDRLHNLMSSEVSDRR